MPKVRVYEISKELGLSNKDVITAAKQLGLELKSHASSVSEIEADKIKNILKSHSSNDIPKPESEEKADEEQVTVFKSESGQEVVERRTGSRVVLRRKKKVVAEPEEPEVKEPEVVATVPEEPVSDDLAKEITSEKEELQE
ncbi:MAG: hypothetical protein GTO02_18865, partial [Candidatus Dadabacteria bacterium]|nr:hypothetical protein [Candidatus Dadabacteria bacterium]NIQ16372.1 hypothetical protein [Candidatus Dadabacteria bacterium]